MKFYKIENSDMIDIFDELTGGPYYIYPWNDGENSYVLFSETEIDDDDLDALLEEKIEAYEEENDD